MHFEEVAHDAALLALLYLQLREELHEPLEALLVAVDPEEVDLEARFHTFMKRENLAGEKVCTFLRLNMLGDMSSLHW